MATTFLQDTFAADGTPESKVTSFDNGAAITNGYWGKGNLESMLFENRVSTAL